MVLDEEREAQRFRSSFHVFFSSGEHVRRSGDTQIVTDLFHLLSRRFVALGGSTRIGNPVLLEGLDHLDTRGILIRGSITEVEVQIEVLLDQLLHLRDRLVLSFQHRNMPLCFGNVGSRITGPVIGRKRISVEILGGQQADAHVYSPCVWYGKTVPVSIPSE